MHLVKKITIIIFVALSCCFYGAGATQNTHTLTPLQWERLKNDEDMRYKNDREQITQQKVYKKSALARFFEMLFSFLGGTIATFIMWGIVIFVVIFIVYKVFFSKDSILFNRTKRVGAYDAVAADDEENILSTDWENLLQKAIDNQDMRLAVRYSYMRALQLLMQRQLINYRSDKTNYDYYLELKNTEQKKLFRQLSQQYEFAWYGQFGVPREMFNDYISKFGLLKNQLIN